MQEDFSTVSPTLMHDLLLVSVIVVGVLALAWILRFRQQWAAAPGEIHPMRLFFRVQRRLGLPLLDCWRLLRLARALGVPHPTALLVSPVLFEAAVNRYCSTAGPPGRRERARARLAGIQKRIFHSIVH
jgi:hypothetical protein